MQIFGQVLLKLQQGAEGAELPLAPSRLPNCSVDLTACSALFFSRTPTQTASKSTHKTPRLKAVHIYTARTALCW